ncbi:helix-hairpin-helix domain-containing protein [Halovenus marina]|uniref:helix-hairpin-helix domain-containing protein n=1 Tax=Halovenus marina TaxID=3396621 RepID=UPI003F560FD4
MSEQKGLLERLKSFLGLSRTSRPESTDDADVTVEREPNTTTEDAVKGTGSATADTPSETVESDTSAESDSSVVSESDSSVVSESDTSAVSESDTSAVSAESDEVETPSESGESEEADEPAPTDSSEDSPPVDEIKGIGPTYADRLGTIGIETVADLADADAADVAEAAQASESRATDWIERATDFE